MSLDQDRRALQRERDSRSRATSDLASLTGKITKKRKSVQSATTDSSRRTRQRELERLQGRHDKAMEKVADYDKKISKLKARITKGETAEAKERDASSRRRTEAHDRAQNALQRDVENLESTSSQLNTRMTNLERTALSTLATAVGADPVDREHDIFLSFAHEDSQTASDLRDELVARGLDVWMMDTNIVLGQSQTLAIDNGIGISRCGVCLVTKHYVDGRFWTRQELAALIGGRKRVIPVVAGLSFSEVAEFSAMLGDRAGISIETHGLDEIAEMICRSLAPLAL